MERTVFRISTGTPISLSVDIYISIACTQAILKPLVNEYKLKFHLIFTSLSARVSIVQVF